MAYLQGFLVKNEPIAKTGNYTHVILKICILTEIKIYKTYNVSKH